MGGQSAGRKLADIPAPDNSVIAAKADLTTPELSP
jgi:hypothetical protein